MRRQILVMLATGVAAALMAGPVSAAQPGDPRYRDILFRESYSLSTSPDHIDEVNSLPGSTDNEWGIALTDAEARKVARLIGYQSQDDALLKFVSKDLPGFAGIYHDNSDEGVYVISTRQPLADADKAQVRDLAPAGAPVRFRVVEHTLASLQELHAEVDAKLGQMDGFTGSEVSLADNAVQVFARPDAVESVRAAVAGYGASVLVTESAGSQNMACPDREDCADSPWRGGLRINDAELENGPCSLGFVVYDDGDDTEYVMSAGHCKNTDGDNWVHPGGPTVVGKTDEVNYWNGAHADVETININQSRGGHIIYATGNNKSYSIDGTQFLSQEAVGDTVCKTGYRTKKSCAELKAKDFTSTEDAPCSPCITLNDMRRARVTTIDTGETYGIYYGDSGGAVWEDGGHFAAGIISREHNNFEAFVYSHITIALDSLEDHPYGNLRVCTSTDSYSGC
jgi:hypothetical protein